VKSELLVVYPPAPENWFKRLLLAFVLTGLILLYFVVRLSQSLKERLFRSKAAPLHASNVSAERYSSSIYAVEQVKLQDLPRGNCWRQMVYAVPEHSKILDVGCSTGHLGRLLLESKPCEIDGVEIDPEAGATAARSYGRVFVGNLSDDHFLSEIPDQTYKLLLFMDVLEHLAEPSALLSRFQSKLSEHGIVLASIPNVAYWQVRFELFRGRFDYSDVPGILDRTHLRFFTFSTVIALFQQSEYRVEWIAATLPGWHALFVPLKRIPFGDNLRVALIRAFPQLLSRQFLVQARPIAA
jgi:2-polyprenyl-3-methyl-5-hydroxy-6-metoxy-1,4-benzoquinol methylase